MALRVARYKRRHWAVYDETDALICVCLYRKGARNVARLLEAKIITASASSQAQGPRLRLVKGEG